MKHRFVRVFVVTIIASMVYFTFFTEKVTDVSIQDKPLVETKIDTLLKEKGYLVIGMPNVVKRISIQDTSKYKDFKIIETYNDDAIIAKKEDKDNLEVYKKFEIDSYFDTYKVPVYGGVLKNPDFTSNEEAKMFKTRITEGCKAGINFAGYFTLIYWGCGTSCQYGVVVNRKTGEIIQGYQSSLGATYHKDSKFLILDFDTLEEGTAYIPLYQLKKFQLKVWETMEFKSLN